MEYGTAAAFRQALEAHLRREAESRRTSVVRLRKLVTFDRLLARLAVAAPGRWIVKGALAIELRTSAHGRATKDLDLGHEDDPEAALRDFLEAQRVDPGDHFAFSVQRFRLDARDVGEEAGTVARFRARAEVAGRLFEAVAVDVVFSEARSWAPEAVRGPDLLRFAGIEPAEVLVVSLERHLAEKIHAYTREYAGGRGSSRVKDLVDILLLGRIGRLDAARLRIALFETFAVRGTHPVPTHLPPPPAGWGPPYRRLAVEVGLDERLDKAFEEARAFLAPVLGSASPLHWDPRLREWIAGDRRVRP